MPQGGSTQGEEAAVAERERTPTARESVAPVARPAGPIDWARWMHELGARVRRVREFVGLSQEQLARLAGVSQGAVSRLEAGRGLATPLLVLMKINLPLIRALRAQDPSVLNDELRQMLDSTNSVSPPVDDRDCDVSLTSDPRLEELIRIYRGLPERQRRTILSVVRATAASLASDDADR